MASAPRDGARTRRSRTPSLPPGRSAVGRFELASQGTLFLDEVGDLPLELQVKLLRVLQDGTFQRLGENRTLTSQARVVSATHHDLSAAVRDGRFREDLYYRLRVVPVE